MAQYNGTSELKAVVDSLQKLIEKQDSRLERLENAMLHLKDAIVATTQNTQNELRREIKSLEDQVDQHAIEIGQLKQGLKIAGVLGGAVMVAIVGIVVTNIFKAPARADTEIRKVEIVELVSV